MIIGPWRLTPDAEAAASGQPLLELAGQLAWLGAALCYGITFGYLRRFLTHRGIPGVVTAFMQIGMGAAAMVLATPFLATGPVSLDLPVVLSLVVLGVVGTGLAYLWNMNVSSRGGPPPPRPSRTSRPWWASRSGSSSSARPCTGTSPRAPSSCSSECSSPRAVAARDADP